MLYLRGDKQKSYRLDCFMYYRYFCLNPEEVTEEYADFFKALDRFFMHKFKCDTDEATRGLLAEIFKLRSERNVIINKNTIDLAMAEYKADPMLLATPQERADAMLRAFMEKLK